LPKVISADAAPPCKTLVKKNRLDKLAIVTRTSIGTQSVRVRRW
jgi:hypothetical protein